MAQRTIQVGDIAQITVQGQVYNFPITSIDSQGIHAGSYMIVPQGSTWQVQGYTVPHTIAFFSAPSVRDKIVPFLEEARRLSGKEITLKEGPRFISLVYPDGNFEYTFARVKKETGDVYSQSGSTSKGNLMTSPYQGRELIDRWGVIVNRQKAEKRLRELTQ